MALWAQEWLAVEEDGERSIPAFEWLRGVPLNVRKQLLAVLLAVRTAGPDRWYDATSHARMRDDLDTVHEVRDKQGEMLYRLFVRWHRDHRRVVILDGREKPNQTALPQPDYDRIEELAQLADRVPPPLATADDFAQELLDNPAADG